MSTACAAGMSCLRSTDAHVWRRGMLRVARMYVSSRAVAEEVVQDARLGVLNGIDRFEGRSSRLVALKTGMRQGELFALRWADVDLEEAVIRVRSSYMGGALSTPKNLAPDRASGQVGKLLVQPALPQRGGEDEERNRFASLCVDRGDFFRSRRLRTLLRRDGRAP